MLVFERKFTYVKFIIIIMLTTVAMEIEHNFFRTGFKPPWLTYLHLMKMSKNVAFFFVVV